MRYIVVNTGNWLSGRQVLVSPFSVVKVDRESSKLHIDLTKSQVEKCPPIDTHKPVSRQMEATHSDYYGYPRYWGSPFLWGPEEYPAAPPATPMTATATAPAPVLVAAEDVHLRSTEEVSSYHIAVTDGDLGHVEDFIIEDNSWVIRYLAMDTRNWLPGRKVMVSPQWIASIDWAQGKVHVNLSKQEFSKAPNTTTPSCSRASMRRSFTAIIINRATGLNQSHSAASRETQSCLRFLLLPVPR